MNVILLSVVGIVTVGAGAGVMAYALFEPESPPMDACTTFPLAERTGDSVIRFQIENTGDARPLALCVLTKDHKMIALRNVTVPGFTTTDVDFHVPKGFYFAQLEQLKVSNEGQSTVNLWTCFDHGYRVPYTVHDNGGGVSSGGCFDAGAARAQTQQQGVIPSVDQMGPAGPAIGVGVAAAGLAAMAVYWRTKLHFAGLLLFSRLARPKVLQLEARARIHDLVQQEPGIHASAIGDRLDLAAGETLYHLHVLTREKLLVRVGNWGLRSFFVAGRYAPHQMRAMAALRSSALDRVYQVIRSQPGATLPHVARAAGYSLGRVSRLTRRLEEVGLVDRTAKGRSLVLTPRAGFDARVSLPRST